MNYLTTLLLTLLSAATWNPAPADTCGDCETGKLCKPHEAFEKAELERLAPDLESKEADVRLDALREVASLTYEHMGAPSKEVARILASALEDPTLRIRETVAELIVDGQHPEISVEAMVDVLESYKRNMWSLVEWLSDKGKRGTYQEAMTCIETTVRACAELRDDRIAKALSGLLEAYPEEMRGQPLALETSRSLLDLGTKDTVKSVLKQFRSMKPSREMRNLHDLLTDFAFDHGVEDYPEFHEDVSDDWERLVRRLKLPKKLGKWKGPEPEEDR